MIRRSCSLKAWRVWQNLSAQHLVHALGCLLLHVGQDVGVGVHCLPYVGVPEHLLDYAGVDVGLEHERGCGVPEGVEAHVRKACVPEQGLEAPVQGARYYHAAREVGEDEPLILKQGAQGEALFGLPLAVALQSIDCQTGQPDAAAGPALGRAPVGGAVARVYRPANCPTGVSSATCSSGAVPPPISRSGASAARIVPTTSG